MSFTMEPVAEMNAILAIWNADFSYTDEADAYENALAEQLDAMTSKTYVIIDMTDSKMTFNDIMYGIQRGSRQTSKTANHPNVEQFIVISNSRTIQMSAAGLEKIGLENLKVKVVASLDEARHHILERVS